MCLAQCVHLCVIVCMCLLTTRCAQTFTDAYRSPLSVIFIDDIERIIEYTPIGHRYGGALCDMVGYVLVW